MRTHRQNGDKKDFILCDIKPKYKVKKYCENIKLVKFTERRTRRKASIIIIKSEIKTIVFGAVRRRVAG